MAKGASAWVKSFRRRLAAYQGRPGVPTAGTGVNYWEAKAAGAFDAKPAAAVQTLTRKNTGQNGHRTATVGVLAGESLLAVFTRLRQGGVA